MRVAMSRDVEVIRGKPTVPGDNPSSSRCSIMSGARFGASWQNIETNMSLVSSNIDNLFSAFSKASPGSAIGVARDGGIHSDAAVWRSRPR